MGEDSGLVLQLGCEALDLESMEKDAEWDPPWAYLVVLKILLEPMIFILDVPTWPCMQQSGAP